MFIRWQWNATISLIFPLFSVEIKLSEIADERQCYLSLSLELVQLYIVSFFILTGSCPLPFTFLLADAAKISRKYYRFIFIS